MADLFILKTSLLEALKPKRLFTAILMMLLPALAAVLWRMVVPTDRFDPAEAYNTLAAYFVFGFTLTILSVIYGTGALSAEIEGRTIVYLLTRPVPRWRLLLMKLIGAWVGITVTVSLSVLLLGLAVYGLKPEWPRMLSDLRIIPVGALAYSSLFLFFATVMARPLIWALLYGFGWENIASLIPSGFAKLSILSYLRTLAPHLKEIIGAQDSAEDVSNLLLRSNPFTVTQPVAWFTVSLVIVLCTGMALYFFTTREFVPREEGG
ncbi:ABC transporter permease [Armatimonas rosea]|uniref:ABC-type transport system involved in multi-copper enzyme maturation permease subunit n=1 Tax=Armatimonas rosea TaxID=685828 RepID=A0A7W9STA7_ARMRO|nr:ABC transporter permease [Armatimonas rosea]MBB6052451.1 ABC-type transport system involved in multi-copper enzyme maturation permease subunit [Armatimonas rosea]